MTSTDNFGDRMKLFEKASDFKITTRLPVILRLDGNSFSKFTKQSGFKKPYDERFHHCMISATKSVLKYCSGAELGYTQSDEITILLRNDYTHNTDPFLANRIQKICSLVASECSIAFNKEYYEFFYKPSNAIFDCRVFVVPPSEVNNVFLWRQKDCFKNCVSSVAYYTIAEKYGKKTTQKMLHKLNDGQRQELLFKECGLNINDYPIKYKRGLCVVRKKKKHKLSEFMDIKKIEKLGKKTPDFKIPMFNQKPNYIGKHLK